MEMKRVYMGVSIDIYTHGAECSYWEQLDGGKITKRELDLRTAQRLMWELKLAGGEKTMEVNAFNPHLCLIEVDYWARR